VSDFILTAAEMADAEAAAVAAGTSVEVLMERAGIAAADAIWRYIGPLPVLVLCGPGNNGGDGYVIARALRERGAEVRVAALADPKSAAARVARERWGGAVDAIAEAAPAPLLIDALFGTGLARPLDDSVARRLCSLAGDARFAVAIDLPSGAATDDGTILSPVADFDLTITFQTLKPSHLLQPAARHMGKVVVADIGIAAESRLVRIARPPLRAPTPDDHKYRRGYVALAGGDMPGAIALAATAAARAGAGYVRLVTDSPSPAVPRSVVQSGSLDILAEDERIGAIVAGPGLGHGDRAEAVMQAVFRGHAPLVLDGDALRWIGPDHGQLDDAVLTPHEGEFEHLFGSLNGSKVERALAAARRSAAVIVLKGADTVVATPDGRAAIAPPASPWLATAGTGDVLAGVLGTMLAQGMGRFEAACAAVWLHGRAAALAGPVLLADDLLDLLPAAVAECL
jgi:ADP-dependent NAD(P)H-hydrate dehydratase / NAD(P)H-hydrate epimerase